MITCSVLRLQEPALLVLSYLLCLCVCVCVCGLGGVGRRPTYPQIKTPLLINSGASGVPLGQRFPFLVSVRFGASLV